MNQVLPDMLRHAEREDRRLPERELSLLATANLATEAAYLLPASHLPEKRLADYPAANFTSLAQAVEHAAELVRQRGMEMLVLDLTRPDIGLPVVKVLVPGMRHFWRRLAPGTAPWTYHQRWSRYEHHMSHVEPTRFWTAPDKRATYPIGWRLKIEKLGLDTEISTPVDDQELNVGVRYWEGCIRIRGTKNQQPLNGKGYLELTGYAGPESPEAPPDSR